MSVTDKLIPKVRAEEEDEDEDDDDEDEEDLVDPADKIKEECKTCAVWYILSKYWMMLKAIHIALYYSSRMIDTL